MKFNVYDTVWTLEENLPKKKFVYAAVNEASHMKKGIDVYYMLVDSYVSATFQNSLRRIESKVFLSKDDAIKSIVY